MLEKLGKFILKYKGAILLAMCLLFAVTLVGTVFLVISDNKINSDMVSYLDEDSDTKKGLQFLQSQFGIRGNATLVVRIDENHEGEDSDYNKLLLAIDNIKKMKSVSGITWYGSISSYESLDNSLNAILSDLNENREYLESIANELQQQGVYDNADDIITLLSLADYFGVDFIRTESMENILRHETSEKGVYDYVLLVMTDIDAGDSAYALLDNIKAEFGFTEYASTGTTETSQKILSETMDDLPWFIVCAVVSVLIILIVLSSSFIEPIILLSTLIIGIIISMGMNYLFPSISIISFAISAVLQLAITMDYAIFYMHTFKRNRQTLDLETATLKTIPEITENVLASGFTTIGGFAALYCMQFKIGSDMANVLCKGVAMSMLTVILLQPILTYFCDKTITKTQHNFLLHYRQKREAKGKKVREITKDKLCRPFAKFSVRLRFVFIIIAIALVVPSFIAQNKVEYSYLELYEKKNTTDEEILANELGNQLIIAVPTKIIKKDASHRDFINALTNINKNRITGVMGAFVAVDIDYKIMESMLEVADSGSIADIKQLRVFLNDEENRDIIDALGITDKSVIVKMCDTFISLSENMDTEVLKSYFKKINDEWYTLYTVSFSGNTEDREARDVYSKILQTCNSYFGAQKYYCVGMITSSYEMDAITPHDFLVVTLVSIAIIYVVVTLLLRNPLKSLFIILIIELGIWINLGFNYLFGLTINFIVYVIISSVQLGCTVDYAILFANTFEKNRSRFGTGKECAAETATETIPPILTSALMIGSVCMGMYFISGNIVIKQLMGMLARGALISFILVVFVQTAVWSFFKTARKDRNYEEKLKLLEESDNPQVSNETETNKNRKI